MSLHAPSVRRIICSWSGGKDSCYSLMKAVEQGAHPSVLLNVLNENGEISRSHGLPKVFLKAQASAIGLPIEFISSSWENYEDNFIEKLQYCKATYQLDEAVYGDIDIESHKDWEDKVSTASNLRAVLPLWQRDRVELVEEMIEAGIQAVIVSCNKTLGVEFLGKVIDHSLIKRLQEMGVDACGENGEYHTAVINCPLFATSISYELGEVREHDHYCFVELKLKS